MPGRRASRSHLHLIVMPQRCSVLRGIGIGDQDGCQARVFCNLTRPKSLSPNQQHFRGCDSQKHPDAWSEGVLLPLAFDCYATKVFCPPWYWNRGPGWLSSQGVLQSDETKISAQISNILRVRLQKHPDAWSEGVLLPLAFDCYATKVFCPPWYWNRGPGWLSSQGVLQSDETKISAQISNMFEGATPETT